jgi:hypothetical protein
MNYLCEPVQSAKCSLPLASINGGGLVFSAFTIAKACSGNPSGQPRSGIFVRQGEEGNRKLDIAPLLANAGLPNCAVSAQAKNSWFRAALAKTVGGYQIRAQK